jgi:hypothetical protein
MEFEVPMYKSTELKALFFMFFYGKIAILSKYLLFFKYFFFLI